MPAVPFSDLEVLIVDDEEFCRTVVARLLRDLGIKKIRHASDGYQGLENLRFPYVADVVVLDFNMPKMNGLEMLKKVREGSAGVDRDQTIAMLTGHADRELVSTAQALDVNAFMVKPTSLEILAGRLEHILGTPLALKDASVYAAIELPRIIRLSSDVARRASSTIRFEMAERRTVNLCLENIPANALLAEEVYGPDGDVLLPAGIRLTPRLLERLNDLRALDDCVARLTVDLAAAT